MWHLSIYNQDILILRLRLPADGLRLGGGDGCDVELPGAAETVKIVPLRKTVLLENRRGERELAAGEKYHLDQYALEATPDHERSIKAPRAIAPSVKTMTYNKAKGTLKVTDYLVRIIEGPDAPREFPLENSSSLVGTLAGCDLVLTDTFVSGKHLKLSLRPEGCVVNDLGSRNGTFIDGVRVTAAVWPAGKPLHLGRSVLALEGRDHRIKVEPSAQTCFAGMVGQSEAMRRVFNLIQQVAGADVTVLITGPTGSGKEMVARALHAHSPRAGGPFVALNCGAVVRELIAGELFGHVRGAFTGATGDRKGLFELAQEGTLFLDEIGELPLELQPHLLRVLEEGQVRRVGGNSALPVDVRVVAATNRDLSAEVKAGRFREDLFYRLDMLTIYLPPLAERLDDLPLLAAHLLKREAERLRRPAPTLSDPALTALQRHGWPGNVRELANVLARTMILIGERKVIELHDLAVRSAEESAALMRPDVTLAEAEISLIRRALEKYRTRARAAEALGIALSTLYEKMKKYRLEHFDLDETDEKGGA